MCFRIPTSISIWIFFVCSKRLWDKNIKNSEEFTIWFLQASGLLWALKK